MSTSISTAPSEDPAVVQALLLANLLSVFGERDESARKAAIDNTYADDVVWYEPDRVIHGRHDLNERAAELLVQSPGFVFQPDGDLIVTQNLGILHWKFGPEGVPDLVKGVDAILVQDGKVKALWTGVTKVPGK